MAMFKGLKAVLCGAVWYYGEIARLDVWCWCAGGVSDDDDRSVCGCGG